MSTAKNLSKVLSPADILPLILIIAGILLAIFLDVTAVRLIGAGVAVIGIIGYVMNLSRRMNEFVDSKYKSKTPPPPNFKITEKKDNSAKRQTIEDFEDNIDEGEIEAPKPMKNVAYAAPDMSGGDEGFRIIKKVPSSKITPKEEPINENKSEENEKIVISIKKQEAKKAIDVEEVAKPSKEEPEKIDVDNFEKEQIKEEVQSEQQIVNDDNQDELFQEDPKKPYVEKKIEISVDNLMEEAPNHEDEPRKEFEYCLSKILLAIRSVSNTSSAVFMLYNDKKEQIKIEAFVTDSPEKINKSKRKELGTDIVSQIIKNKKPEILSEINPDAELELIPYYTKANKTISFIGVPVFYNGEVIGVLCADSIYEDAYDSVIVNFFGHFTKLIATLLNSYIEKFDLIQARKTLNAISLFDQKSLNKESDPSDIIASLLEVIKDLTDVDLASVGLWNDIDNNYFIADLRCDDNDYRKLINAPIESESIVMDAFRRHEPLVTFDLESDSVRYSKMEPENKTGVLISIPIVANQSAIGVLILESTDPSRLSDDDISMIFAITAHAGSSIEKLLLNSMLNEGSVYDSNTGLINENAFLIRLEEEIERAKILDTKIGLSIISVDEYESFADDRAFNLLNKANEKIVDTLNRHKRKFDVAANMSDGKIAILFPGYDHDRSRIWGEKYKSEIASSIVESEGKQFNVTVCIGQTNLNNASNVEEAIEQASTALEKARELRNSVVHF